MFRLFYNTNPSADTEMSAEQQKNTALWFVFFIMGTILQNRMRLCQKGEPEDSPQIDDRLLTSL